MVDAIRKASDDDATYKAVVVTNNYSEGAHIASSLPDVGIMQRRKGRICLAEQRVLREFQGGRYRVLVCSTDTAEVGVNLEQARQIFFSDKQNIME